MGTLAMEPPTDGLHLRGILVKKNFAYHLLAPEDLHKYTDMVQSSITQKLSVPFGGGDFSALSAALSGLENKIINDGTSLLLLDQIRVSLDKKNGFAVLEWSASPIADMYADTVIAILLKQSINGEELKQLGSLISVPESGEKSGEEEDQKPRKMAKTISNQAREFLFTNFIIESIRDMFGLEENQLSVAVKREGEDNLEHKMVTFTLNDGEDEKSEMIEVDITRREVVKCERDGPRTMLNRLLGASGDIEAKV